MDGRHTEAAFEQLSWHDCPVWGLAFRVGDPQDGDWTSDLVLDIDFIVEWTCGLSGGPGFRVAPAELAFHGVTDPRIAIDWGDSGGQTGLHELSIDAIHRERVRDQKVFLDRPYYRWRIALNWPAGGELAFGAVGFTQTLRAAPVRTEQPRLSRRERTRPTGG
jgi:hypothetical protein